MFLGAAYMLYLYRRVIFGKLTKKELFTILDLDRREIAIFTPLILVVLWMGVFPNSFLDPIDASVARLIENYHLSLAAGEEVSEVLSITLLRGAQ